jgi:hypothetical protein
MMIRPFTKLARGVVLLAAMFMLFASSGRAVTTTTPLSEGFVSSTFPPSGWSADVVNPTYGWYWGSGGLNGSNGCAMVGSYYAKAYYGITSESLTSIPVDASAYATTGDSTFVDFDLFLPYNYYSQNYGTQYDNTLKVIVGSTTLKTLKASTDNTFRYYSYSYVSDPASGYTSSYYWRHYRFLIPQSERTSSMTVIFQNLAGYYCANLGIDNVVITNNHYTQVTAAPITINFGNIGVGIQTATQYVVITNPNLTPVTISAITMGGSNPGDFIITRSVGTIAPNSKDSIGLAFLPTAKFLRQATLTFNTGADIPTSVSVDIRGYGLVPLITIPANTVPFIKTRTRFDNTIFSSFIVTNTGGISLIISPTTFLSGDFPGEYRITRLPSAPIAPGQWDTITLSYSPTMEGLHTALLNIISNADNGTQVILLKGTGILPRLALTPTPLKFDSVGIGDSSCKYLTLYNPGSDTIALSNNYFASSDADFSFTKLIGDDTLIAPDHSKQILVCFRPIRNGAREARLRFTTNIPRTFDSPRQDTSSFIVNIQGTGVPFGRLAVSGRPMVDSGEIGKSICRTDTLWNMGTVDLTITSAMLTGANAAEYTVSGVTFPLTIGPGSFVVFNVCAVPGARGDRNAQLNLLGTSNGRATTAMLSLDVFGQLVCVSSTPNAAFTAKTCVGMTDTASVEVTNCGDIATAYNAVLTGTGYMIIGPATSSNVGATGKTTFKVAFTPTTRGTSNGTLDITGGTASTQVTLSGTGAAAMITGTAPQAADTKVGETSAAFDVPVKNDGECDWVPGPPANGGAFTCTGGSNTSIPAGGTGKLTFTFTPTQVGANTATITFPAQIGTSLPPASITLNGTGLAKASVRTLSEAQGFSLAQNYPNPFNPTTEIRFTLPHDAKVKLEIMDVTGQIVRTVFNERYSVGSHSTVVDASTLASGTYYYTLTTNDGSIRLTRQMVLVK